MTLADVTMPKIESKLYRCTGCGYESRHSTNHWGEFYDRCPKCSWKSPMDPIKTHQPVEEPPEGAWIPAPWKKVKLGDICEIEVLGDVETIDMDEL